jgi:hypothetical protein
VLYDVSSTYFEGRTCPLARRGYSRDGKRDKLQIIFGLLCASDGCPVAVEVFEGNTGDPSTLAAQVAKLKQRFHLDHVVLVGDRGMITEARVETVLKPAGLDWITALRAPTIRTLLEQGAFQLSLFDERDLAEVTSADFPDDRLVVCRNPGSPPSVPANAWTCWPPPKPTCARWPKLSPARPNRCAAPTRSASPPVRCSIGIRWPSTSS